MLYTVPEVAKQLGLSISTVKRYIHKQKLKAVQIAPGTHYRITKQALEEFQQEHL